jgi:mono/diheme cytochrome c family protein
MRLASLLIGCLLFSLSTPVSADEARINVILSQKVIGTFTASELKAVIPPKVVTYYDIRQKKERTSDAFPLKVFLDHVYGPTWQQSTYMDIIFVGRDGSSATGKTFQAEEGGGYIGFLDLESPDMELIPDSGRGKSTAFQLFWTGEAQRPANDYPWPSKIATIKLVQFEDQYPKVVPKGIAENTSAYRGFVTFRGQCFKCHAINRQGGKIGPDLNAPQSIVDYRPEKILKAFIREPSKYRYTTMPDQTHLTDNDLDDLVAYFKVKSKQPK